MTAATSAARLIVLVFLTEGLFAEEVVLSVNTKKPLTITSEKFLSITLDPTSILTGNLITDNLEKSINMAKALSPAYVRIAGPRSNSYTFARDHTTLEDDPSFIFTEAHWNTLNGWAASAGLDVVAALAPQQHSEASGTAASDAVWDSRNVLDLISSSDHMGFNVSWQLGFECQTRCDISGGDLGKDVMRLRSMLEAFPRFAKSIIAGPDVVTFKTKLQQGYLQDYLNAGVTGLSAITWHPDFASITVDPVGVSMHHDTLALDKDALYRVIGRNMAKKPLWLAESKPEECKKQFLGALVWTRRLGNSAKLGAQVLMRQPQESNLFDPTPDYWVSVLHKTLVGREVLDTKIATGNRTHIHFYCQCTRPSSKYEKGSLTVFGINLTPAKLSVSLKGLKIKTLHKYILLPGFDAENRMFSETVLLNNEPLKLENGKDMPEINPAVATSGKGLSMKLPSGGIGFWVIPDLKIKSCEGPENDNVDMMLLKKLSKRLEDYESEEDAAEEDLDGQEIDDNFEERPSFIRAYRRRWKKSRYSTEEDEPTRYKKLEARRDLERLEKLLKWRENLEERRMSTLRGKPAHIGFEDKSYEMNSDNESEREIRAKLQLYRRRLDEYETRRRNSVRSRDKQTLAESDALDNEKIEEAMRLINKVENAMKSLEEDNQDSLNAGNDVGAGLNGTNAEESFLDELLKTRKIRRTVPEKIEEQLRGIYEMLAEEKARRQRLNEEKIVDEVRNEPLSRSRRDVDKKFGDDPLGLRKDSFFTRRRSLAEELKERRLEKHRRRNDKKENGAIFFDPKNPTRNSNENNFYGFARREPLKGFPAGDVHVMTGESTEETTTKSNDYDYVNDDDYMPDQGRRNRSKNTGIVNQPEIVESWVEDENAEIGDIPKEFLESTDLNSPKIQKHLENYGELWEAESLADAHEIQRDEKVEFPKETILQEKPVAEHQDKQAKDTVVKQLMEYYENPPSNQWDEDDTFGPRNDNLETSMKSAKSSPTPQYPRKFPESRIARFLQRNPVKINTRHRRDTNQLDSVLDKEMIFQDENNLKDCNCRVIRGLKNKECKACKVISERIELAKAKRLAKKNKKTRERVRVPRDASAEEEAEESYEDEEDLVEDGSHEDDARDEEDFGEEESQEFLRHSRDTLPQTTVPPPSLTTLATTNPTTTATKKPFQAPKNLTRTTRAQGKSSRSIKNGSKLPENISTKKSENKTIEKTNSPVTEATPGRVSTSGIAGTVKTPTGKGKVPSIPQAENITLNPENNKKDEQTTTELPHSLTTTPGTLGKTKAMKKNPRSPRRIQQKVKPTPKTLDISKVRRTRLTAKSQPVLAKKDADTKKIEKIPDSPTKILAAETAKLQALHKERLEQLVKLRERLRLKRNKLQESILQAELGKSADSTTKVVKRREIMQLLKEEQELQSIVDKGKWDYAMLYKPRDYAPPTKVNSEEDLPESKYFLEDTEVDSPLHEVQEKTEDNPRENSYEEVIESSEDSKVPEDHIAILEGNEEMLNEEFEQLSNEQIFTPQENCEGEVTKDKNKSEFICMKEDSNAASPEDSDPSFEIVKEEDHFISIPSDENKESPSNLQKKTKYQSPKYARLAVSKLASAGQKESSPQGLNEDKAINVDEALNSSKYEMMMLVPLKNQKQRRERRDLGNDIKRWDSENDIWGNDIELKKIERKKHGDDSPDIYAAETILRIQPATVQSQPAIQEDPLSSLVEEAIPKIGDAVTNGLGKAQNVTGSIEKLINEFEETRNEAENVDEKTQFEMAVKNNPDGLLTHEFFRGTIQNVKAFFNFLGGITHVFFAH